MENSFGRKYVNISNRKFERKKYEYNKNSGIGYKPGNAFWCSLESSDPNYYSEWDLEYGEILNTDDNGYLYATSVKLSDDTYVLNPDGDELILEAFQNFIKTSNKELSAEQRRKLLVEIIKSRENLENIKYVICQIDLPEDLDQIERIFGGYEFGKENPDCVYENLQENVKKAFTENFSGVEVTGCALGLTKMSCYMGNIFESARYKKMNDSKYDVFLGEWEMHSLAIFDTDCIDVVEEKSINTKLRDHDDNEERY